MVIQDTVSSRPNGLPLPIDEETLAASQVRSAMASFIPTATDWAKYSEQGQRLLVFVQERSKVPQGHQNYALFRSCDAIEWLVRTNGFPSYRDALRFGQALLREKAIALHSGRNSNVFRCDDSVFKFLVRDGDHLKRLIGMVRIWDDDEAVFDPTADNPNNPFTADDTSGEKRTVGDAEIMEIREPVAYNFEMEPWFLSALQMVHDKVKPTTAYNFVDAYVADEVYRTSSLDSLVGLSDRAELVNPVIHRLPQICMKLRRIFGSLGSSSLPGESRQ